MKTKYLSRREKIKFSIRKKLSGTEARPRLSVFRSNQHIYAQLIDDVNGLTLVSCSTSEKGFNKAGLNKVDQSKLVGNLVAEKALAKGIDAVTFDRNGFLYHGRIKSLADGAREKGLKF